MMRYLLTQILFLNVLVSFAQQYNSTNSTLERLLAPAENIAFLEEMQSTLLPGAQCSGSWFNNILNSTLAENNELSDGYTRTFCKVSSQHKLVGFAANYSNKVNVRDDYNYWLTRPTVYTFSISVPLWQSEWFMGLLLLVISGIILLVIRLRERGLKKMNTLLDLRVKHRTSLLERKHLEKEMLLKETHHRVKNNLQIVMSLLNLQARHIKDPQAQEAMQAIRSRVRAMSLLHEQLYQLNNLAHINLEKYLREVCESLYDAFGTTKEEINLTLQIPPIIIDIDTAITLGLIVNELISNALKYAFVLGQGGQIVISLRHDRGNEYVLTVQDNGRGMPEHFEDHEHKPFGLNLVAALSKNLDGKILFENNNGTKAILYFVLPS